MKKNNILIVGGTGFIGFHLAKEFAGKNWDVSCVSTKPPLKNRRINKVKYITVNISNKKKLKKKIKKRFNIVVNLGGYVDHKNKTKTFRSHFIGCQNLYDVFKNKKLKIFIQMGSSLEYGSNVSPLIENLKCKPKSIYGKSKLLATNFLLKKFNKEKFPAIVLRLFQAYGPNQDINRLIPIVIEGCIQNKKFACSTGNQLRDFIYIDDVIKAITSCVNSKNAIGNIFNIGLGKPKKVKSVIKNIRSIINSGQPQFGKIKMRKDEIKSIYPNINKAKKILKWQPKIEFRKGLIKTIKYYSKNANK